MATATLQDNRASDSSELLAREPTVAGPLLVATDGSVRCDAAVRAARAIASVTRQQVLVLAVHAPLPVMGPEVQLATSPAMDEQSRIGLLGQVADQLDRVGIADWPVEVTTGSPAATVATRAKTIDASLIVMGLGGHGVLEQVFGDEMALQVLRVGLVPILAVAEDFRGLPSRALCAVDFSASSKRALELGGPLVRAGGRLTLAHVITSDTDPVNLAAMDRVHVGSIGRALKRETADVDFCRRGDLRTSHPRRRSGERAARACREVARRLDHHRLTRTQLPQPAARGQRLDATPAKGRLLDPRGSAARRA